jgi:hypothetical protein
VEPVLLALGVGVAIAAALARRGSLVAATCAAGAAVLAVEALLGESALEPLVDTYGVGATVSVLAAATAGGLAIRALAPGRLPVGRASLAVAGLLLLALVVFPMRGAADPARMTLPGWRSGSLGILLAGIFGDLPFPPLGWAVAVLGHTAVGAAALALAIRGRGRALAVGLVAAWGATLLAPIVHAAVAPDAGGANAPPAGWLGLAAMRAGPVFLAAAWVGWVARWGGRPEGDPSGPIPDVGR